MSDVDELTEVEKFLGTNVIVPINGKNTKVTLVDGEEYFNQPGMSAGFVHFADPEDLTKCLGFAGVYVVWNLVIAPSVNIIRKKVYKPSKKPFKSGEKVNTVNGVVTNPQSHYLAFTFEEDDSIVDVRMCKEYRE